jgi:GH35 family endo-1,4-beta-xylanase
MTRHAFGFGCVVNPGAHQAEGPDAEKYRELFAKHFNKAPLESGFRWQNWFRPDKQRRREILQRLSATLDWLNERDIEVRGHYLMWGPVSKRWQPPELLDEPNALRAAHARHMAEKARWAGKRVQEWDAINHIVGWGRTYADIFGKEIYADVIRRGRKLAPHAEMWINEGQVLPGGSRRDPYYAIAKWLIEHDAAPDGIGFMGHFAEGSMTAPEELRRVLDRYAKLGLSLQLTEFDVDTSDEQLQADYLRDVMTICFSHPAVEAVVMWGFWEGRHWRPNGALWRRDWSIKPAGRVWLDLVRKQWWTDESGDTDAEGAWSVRGFHGDYELSVSAGGKSRSKKVRLGPEGATVRIRME